MVDDDVVLDMQRETQFTAHGFAQFISRNMNWSRDMVLELGRK